MDFKIEKRYILKFQAAARKMLKMAKKKKKKKNMASERKTPFEGDQERNERQ